MPVREQSAVWHDRLVCRVAVDASAARIGGSGVLMLVAGRAHLGSRLALRGVSSGDVLVAIAARRALGALIFVGAVAAQAVLRAVDFYCR